VHSIQAKVTACCKLESINGDNIEWVSSCRYLGVWLMASRHFKCDFSFSKKSFFRAVNAIFGKVLHIATEDTVLHLIATKCIPILLYGLDVCPLNVADNRSLDFVQTRLLMKLGAYLKLALLTLYSNAVLCLTSSLFRI